MNWSHQHQMMILGGPVAFRPQRARFITIYIVEFVIKSNKTNLSKTWCDIELDLWLGLLKFRRRGSLNKLIKSF